MNLSTKRHSLAHIMAQAVNSLYPNVKLAIGPDIENGFYYDFDFGEDTISDKDLKNIEKKMKNIIKQNQKFNSYSLPIDEAINYLKKNGEDYKIILAEKLKSEGETELSFYENINQKGEKVFVDMCSGPHINQTLDCDINSFKLDKVAGAYFLGNEKNKMLTRIYAFAFENREELDEHLAFLREAKKRDHKVLGKKLDLFSFHHQSPGSAFWHPNGLIIWRELEDFWRKLHNANGYTEIQTPQMAKNDLWKTSGHWDHYSEDMFSWENGEDETLCLKPMDCPFGILIYNSKQNSYKDLPIRFNEIGRIFRNEKSGELNGLFRVRSITQDDAHIYTREDQIFDEINNILSMVKEFYDVFNIKPNMFLSTRPDSFLGEIKTWDKAEKDLKQALETNNIEYGIKEGDGAFYGPKIDVQIKDCLGRTWQLATIQLDFQLPGRFGMEYTDKDGEKKTPVVIHRAIFGSFERFIGILIEHFAGVFPLWLAPKQVLVLPVADKFNDYAEEIVAKLKSESIRCEADLSTDGLNKKVRNAEKAHNNYILVLGEEEVANGTVSVRNYKTKEQSLEKYDDFIKKIKEEIITRKI